MTACRASFALHVEDLLNKIGTPEYRQLTIEALLALSGIARANRNLKIDGYLVVDVVISTAVRLAWEQNHAKGEDPEYGEHLPDAWNMLYASPPDGVANYIMAAVTFCSRTQQKTQARPDAEAPVAESELDIVLTVF